MMKMTLNNTVEFEIAHYNRYTDIRSDGVSANANFSLTSMSAYDDVVSISNSLITDIKIENNGVTIYDLTDQHAKISRINESVYEGGVSIDVGITFNAEESVEE